MPQIARAVDWLKQARAGDPLHIVPVTDNPDDELINGHTTGYNFMALSGLRLAIQMAAATGHADLAQDWQAEYDSFHQAFFKVLDERTRENNGYIPPALDGQHGFDWGNMLSVVPEPVLDPHDARVTATLKATQAKYAEGIMTYDYAHKDLLHLYLTIKNTMTEVIAATRSRRCASSMLNSSTPVPPMPDLRATFCPGPTATSIEFVAARLVRGRVPHLAADDAGS